MVVIRFKELLMPEAEHCVAEIWTCLERYHIPSPTISFEYCDSLGVRITLKVDDPVAANTLRAWLLDCVEEENVRFVRKRSPHIHTYTEPVRHDDRGAAPLSFVLALAAPTTPSHAISRPRRK